jgi:hypothetical protein
MQRHCKKLAQFVQQVAVCLTVIYCAAITAKATVRYYIFTVTYETVN